MIKQIVSRFAALMCAALIVTAVGSVPAAAAAIPETPFYFDADYIVNGKRGPSGQSANEFWRHSVAELAKVDGKTCLKMVAATDENHPTQVNIYWADSVKVEDGAINLDDYPYMLMSYKSSIAGEWQLVTGANKAYYDKIDKIVADKWSTSIVNVKTAKVTKGSYLQIANELRIRFWGESASKNYVGAEFYLEYIAFFKTSADAEAFVKSRQAPAAETKAPEKEQTSSPKTADTGALALLALTVSGAAFVLTRQMRGKERA